MASRMDEALRFDTFPHLILGLLMIGIEHKLLTNFLNMKPSTFQALILRMHLSLSLTIVRGYIKWVL